MNKRFKILQALMLCFTLLNIPLNADTLAEQLTKLQDHDNLLEVKKNSLQLLIEELKSNRISWQEDEQVGLGAFIGGQNTEKTLVFATSILNTPLQLSNLVNLLKLSNLQPPKNNLHVLFLLNEEIEQPERTQFSYPPYNQFKISPFNSSQVFLSTGEATSIAAVFYLVTFKEPALIITKNTPLSLLKMAWSEFNFLPLSGGLREFSRVRDFPELENLYAHYNIPLILLSMPETTNVSRQLYKLSQQSLENSNDSFFYALSFNKKLYILQGFFIYLLLIVLQLCWTLADLTRFHSHINWQALISFLLLLIASISLTFVFENWLLALFPQTLGKRALSYFIALLTSQIILFLPLRLPRTQLSLRLLEASLAILFIYACMQRPLTALLIILVLILLTFCQHLWQVTLRRLLISTTLFLIFLLFFFLAIEEAIQDASSYFGLLLVLPVLALVSLQHNLHGIHRHAQIWLNIIIFSLTIFTITLSLRTKAKLQISNTLINYRFEFSDTPNTKARIYYDTENTAPISLNNIMLQYSGQETQITLEKPVSQLNRLANKRRGFYTLHVDYQHPLRVLLIKLPEQTFVRDKKIQTLTEQLLVFYQPSLPLDFELASFQDQPLKINFAATLAQEPFSYSLSSHKAFSNINNTELYWELSATDIDE